MTWFSQRSQAGVFLRLCVCECMRLGLVICLSASGFKLQFDPHDLRMLVYSLCRAAQISLP